MMTEHPQITALKMKQAEQVGDLRQRIWAEQAEARKTCAHPAEAVVHEDMDYQDEKMSRPERWKQRRCMTCNSVVARTMAIWVKTDFIGNPLIEGGNWVKAEA